MANNFITLYSYTRKSLWLPQNRVDPILDLVYAVYVAAELVALHQVTLPHHLPPVLLLLSAPHRPFSTTLPHFLTCILFTTSVEGTQGQSL